VFISAYYDKATRYADKRQEKLLEESLSAQPASSVVFALVFMTLIRPVDDKNDACSFICHAGQKTMKFLLHSKAGLAFIQKVLDQSQKFCTFTDELGDACSKDVRWQSQISISGRTEVVSDRAVSNLLKMVN
jgi:hypothetical protein